MGLLVLASVLRYHRGGVGYRLMQELLPVEIEGLNWRLMYRRRMYLGHQLVLEEKEI